MFVTRLISGIVLLIIAFGSFLMGSPVLTLLLWAISLIGYEELFKALHVTENGMEKKCALNLIGLVGITSYYGTLLTEHLVGFEVSLHLVLLACICGTFLAEMFAYVICFPKYEAHQVSFSIFAFLYAPVMLAFIDLIRQGKDGKYLVWFVLIASWGCDTCAYVTGMLCSKIKTTIKVFPKLSPKKSLEGCIGGVIGAALLGMLYGKLVMDETTERMVLLGIICGVGGIMSMAGDLAASAIKRNNNIKDYGKLIPGHGGIMDRFDSVIVTAPIVYFLIQFVL